MAEKAVMKPVKPTEPTEPIETTTSSHIKGNATDRIYADSENKYVKNTVLYARDNDEYAYLDEAFTEKVDRDTLFNLCVNGVLVQKNTDVFIPYCFTTPDADYLTIKFGNGSSSNTAYSREYSPRV